MTRFTRCLLGAAVMAAMANPAAAQATARSGPPASSSGSSGSGAGSQGARDPGGAPSMGTAVPRSMPSTPSSSGSSAQPASTNGSSGGSAQPSNGPNPTGTRTRNGQPIIGLAGARTPGSQEGLSFVNGYPISAWNRWYPWFSGGFGANYGYVTMDPWEYGTDYWVWGQNGLWWYNPWATGSSYGGYYDPLGDMNSLQTWNPQLPTGEAGSIRLRVSPSSAKVYVDGVLKGVVDEFDGLSHHLEVEPGPHHLDIKADGYRAYSADITVEANKTMTFRASLKKQ